MAWLVGFIFIILLYVYMKTTDRIFNLNLERKRDLHDLTKIIKANKSEILSLRVEIRALKEKTREMDEPSLDNNKVISLKKLSSQPSYSNTKEVWDIFLEYISYGMWEYARLRKNTEIDSIDTETNTYTVKVNDREPISEYDFKDKFEELYENKLSLKLIYYNELDEIRK